MKKIHLTILIIALCFPAVLLSQNTEDKKHIKKETNTKALKELQEKFEKEHKQLLLKAALLGISTTFSKSKNKTGTLTDIRNGVPSYDIDDNINVAKTGRIDLLWNGGSLGLDLSGSGITIGHWEASGVPFSIHNELNTRVNILESATNGSHATHTAGTLIATGVNASAKGMANGALIDARRSNNDESEMAAFAANGGILSSHSYSSGDPSGNIPLYGYYANISKDWDEIAYNAPFYTICKSAGNTRNDGVNVGDGGYDILYSQGVSKNVITVGAVMNVPIYTGPGSVTMTSFSSYGPTDDWRIKPDLVTNGSNVFSSDIGGFDAYGTKSGTSMSTPSVAGAIALLQQHYHNINSVYMKSATVKALLINTTDEAGSNPGPDFSFGWGLLNAERAAQLISNNSTTSKILEGTLSDGQSFEFTITVDGSTPLALTMAWTDVPGTPIPLASLTTDQMDLMLVNDLDVRVMGTSTTYEPWIIQTGSFTNAATTGDNFRDNVEKIEVSAIPAGTYTVKVTHKGQLHNSLDQDFSIAVDNITSSTLSGDQFSLNRFSVYPNPVSQHGILHISAPDELAINTKVILTDIYGKTLIRKTISEALKLYEVDTSNLAKGIYLLQINSNNKSYSKKIVIE